MVQVPAKVLHICVINSQEMHIYECVDYLVNTTETLCISLETNQCHYRQFFFEEIMAWYSINYKLFRP